jgi:hypothetical protein
METVLSLRHSAVKMFFIFFEMVELLRYDELICYFVEKKQLHLTIFEWICILF